MRNFYEWIVTDLRKVFFRSVCAGLLIAMGCVWGAGSVHAGDITLGWTANTSPYLKGYKIYYGTSKTSYASNISVAKTTSCTLSGLKEGVYYYFAATVLTTDGKESGFSNQVAAYIPVSGGTASSDVVHRINAGGSAVTAGGVDWDADRYYSGSTKTYRNAASIAGTTADLLYQTERFGKTFGYSLPVSSGVYTVKLHFAEIYFSSVNSRVFDLEVENRQFALDNFDIVREVGSKTAVVKTINNVRVVDGSLDIDFGAAIDNGKISAIEVILVSANI